MDYIELKIEGITAYISLDTFMYNPKKMKEIRKSIKKELKNG